MHDYFILLDRSGALARMHEALYVAARSGRKGGEPVGGDHRQPERQGRSKRGCALERQGYDAGTKVTGRKRHVLVDTLGLLPSVVVHPNDVPDRDGARLVLSQARKRFPFIETIFADGGDQGPKVARAVAATGSWRLTIVKRNDETGKKLGVDREKANIIREIA